MTDVGPHPDWAIAAAEHLMASLPLLDTREDQKDLICLELRAAFHLGAGEAIKEMGRTWNSSQQTDEEKAGSGGLR